MKTTDIGIKRFPCDFHEQNTFICGRTATLLSVATTQLSKLEAEHNTVLITDTISFGRQCVNLYKWNEPPVVSRWLMMRKDML